MTKLAEEWNGIGTITLTPAQNDALLEIIKLFPKEETLAEEKGQIITIKVSPTFLNPDDFCFYKRLLINDLLVQVL